MKRSSRGAGKTLATLAAPAVLAVLLAGCGGGTGSTVGAISQTVTLTAPSAGTAGGTGTLSATASSGLTAFTYASSTPAVCTVSGATVTYVSAGACSVTASQAGNANYQAAVSDAATIAVAAGAQAQTVTISAPATGAVGGTGALTATSTSGLTAFTFASQTPAVCTVSGATVSYVASGTCSVTASQAGDAAYAPATSAAASIAVSGTAQSQAFSSGFADGNLTVEGGGYGGYGGSDLDGYGCNGTPQWCGGGGTTTSGAAAAQTDFYFYYQTPSPAAGEYVGVYVQAPGVTGLSTTGDTPGVHIAGQTAIAFTLSENPEWFTSGTSNFGVLLTLGKLYTVNGPACNLKLLAVVTPTAQAATAYTVPFSDFVVTQNCGDATIATAAQALAASPVSQVDFQGDGGAAAVTANGKSTGANLSVAANGVYPTTIDLQGGITFTP